jgi:hypothetical protein
MNHQWRRYLLNKYGMKTMYYCNTNDGSGDDAGCAGGACSV